MLFQCGVLRSLLAESDQVGRPGVRGPKSIELDVTLLAVGNKSRRQKKSLGLSSEWDTDFGRPGVPERSWGIGWSHLWALDGLTYYLEPLCYEIALKRELSKMIELVYAKRSFEKGI
ncbi:hypothetical protein LSTR_LSTR000349 [Laodelphax striatellus]|uniref:Uncharacterized protein n=1 Tax=Laodelphax striatellus TaxID=195883 RepID=A0A482X4Z0_LAOST|nr:hypothetical protein LSTR_LSTR000349 [Laodelphax striatellus]